MTCLAFFQMSKERAFPLTGLLFDFWFVSLTPGFIPSISDGEFHGMKLNVMQRCCSFTSAITESRITFNRHKRINTRRELWLHNSQDRLERYRHYGTHCLSLPILVAIQSPQLILIGLCIKQLDPFQVGFLRKQDGEFYESEREFSQQRPQQS